MIMAFLTMRQELMNKENKLAHRLDGQIFFLGLADELLDYH